MEPKKTQCTQCASVVLSRNYKLHQARCKGVPKNTCKNCRKEFKHASSLSRHRKICNFEKGNEVNAFGQEDTTFYKERTKIDERYRLAASVFSDALDLLYFNADRPENHTVRKNTKKSDLIELRLGDGTWESLGSKEAVSRLKENTERALNVSLCSVIIKHTTLKDLLYVKTKRGTRSEAMILEKHTGPLLEFTIDNHKLFLESVTKTCGIYQNNLKQDFIDSAEHVREYIMDQAKVCRINNFTLRDAESEYQRQLAKL